jgi:hypothetical protein
MDMNTRHLIFAYCLVWILQLGYLTIVLRGWRKLKKKNDAPPSSLLS